TSPPGGFLRKRIGAALVALLTVTVVANPPVLAQNPTPEQLYELGYLLGLLGEHEKAIGLFKRSLALKPTAEAQTFLGWTYGNMGRLEEALEEAKKAIPLDPEFGNPYNDIGVYLIELGRLEEAIPYLEKAMRAKRYCCYHYAHFNRGRIHFMRREYRQAREQFEEALRYEPSYLPARQGLKAIQEVLKES
ncbi:MAG: tetratricopeptide repeat protein, partial [Candidatus Tectomicrobia bacterium]|nr:tetratricopeptide repeat protein [Candidatus Tectomicrobia bacterium]